MQIRLSPRNMVAGAHSRKHSVMACGMDVGLQLSPHRREKISSPTMAEQQ